MNCKEAQSLITDIARHRPLEASSRNAADAHIRACDNCAARLIEARQLTAGLRALALTDENLEASAQVEAGVLSAFRKQVARHQKAEVLLAQAVSARQLRGKVWAVAAMVILLMLALLALRIQNGGKEAKPFEQDAVNQAPAPQKVKSVEKDSDKRPAPEVAPARGAGAIRSKPRQPRPSGKAAERLNPRLAANPNSPNPAKPVEPAVQEEIATSFISLTQGYTLPMAEGGQVVRVELPRSALASFGLPVNAERLNEPVKADIVVGNDGIARAIRFVR